ncbi:MAG: adenosylcobalamin-dependent ribonucleoside-diphosphate reductase [Chloroflexi bacterium]|nr:adenosylcobalamin-dependent ribonucleoside-diphosphate reductase [Chloroflexota bacterium]
MLKETKTRKSKSALLPTPPLPKSLRHIELGENALKVFQRRYMRRGNDGQPIERVEQTYWRVAYHVGKVEEIWGGDATKTAGEFYYLLGEQRFTPNSPTFTGAGTPIGQLAACFVLPISDDMGRASSGIFQTLRDAALIQQTGGGNGFAFSRLRPKDALVKTSAGRATGPVGFLRVYDQAFGEIAQGGCLLPETLVFTDRGLLRLDEILDAKEHGWQSHALQVATDEGWRKSPRAYNNGVAPVLRAYTRQGLSLAGTHDHRVKVMTDQGPDWRRLDELQPGDWILVQLGKHRGKLQALRQPRKTHGNQIWPKLPSVLDEELAFFLGYLAGDGFIASHSHDHRVGVSVAHSSYLQAEMPDLLARLFGAAVHKQQKPQDRSATFVIDNRAVKEFMRLNGFDKPRSQEVHVPRLVRQSPREVVGAYLRGLFEADGTLSHGYPTLTTTSPRLAEETATLLIGLGCPVRIRSVAPGVEHYGKSRIYIVRIESTTGLQAWRKTIGCDQRSRFVAAQSWESDTRRESSYVIPAPRYWLQSVLDAITLEQVDARGRGLGHKFRSTRPRLRHALLRYLRNERQFTRSTYDELRSRFPEFAAHSSMPDGWWFVQVAGVEPAGEASTLDLEVEETHTYLAYGMVTHNTRRGANMAVLRVDHPDVEEFITCKTDENAITNFNISVGITDAFMRAVRDDADWDLRFVDVTNPDTKGFDGTLEQAEAAGLPIRTYKTVKARALFEKIVTQAHHNGEPGLLFLDASNRSNPVPHLYPLEATNPCGEQWLGPYENCCLGSINLAQHFGPARDGHGTVDWDKLRISTELSTRFLDDVVEENAYVPAVPQLKEAAHRARRIGLGIMALADLLYHVGIRYGSEEAQEFGAQVMEFVRFHSMRTSIALAKERGPFTAIKGSIYDPENITWKVPTPLRGYQRDYGRPTIDWSEIITGIQQYGIRNACQTTIAPTGTIATISGCEGYGCEPVFALAYLRHVNDQGKDLTLTYTSPLFEQALEASGLDAATREKVIAQVVAEGSCQNVTELPENIRNTFVVSGDISAEEHVRMQGALQAFVDNSLSKTINFPAGATEVDVATAYMLAWELGCKGITVYVTGSRDKVVLETHATAKSKETPAAMGEPIWNESRKPRSGVLHGSTYKVETPLGTAFVTINQNGDDQPFEAFITSAKAGSETAAVSEAIGRLISYVLRLASPIAPRQRLLEIRNQLAGLGGDRQLGLGPKRVRSLPDGVSKVIDEYLRDTEDQAAKPPGNGKHDDRASLGAGTPGPVAAVTPSVIGELCPECGHSTLVNEEGCKKCYTCSFSEC